MALTIQPVRGARSVSGTIREELFDITFDNSYPTGGFSVDARQFGLGASLFGITPCGQSLTSGAAITTAYVLTWNPATGKIQLFQDAGAGGPLAEVPNATNLSTRRIRVRVTGG